MVRARRKRSNAMGATVVKIASTGPDFFAAFPARHWPPIGEYTIAATHEDVSLLDPRFSRLRSEEICQLARMIDGRKDI